MPTMIEGMPRAARSRSIALAPAWPTFDQSMASVFAAAAHGAAAGSRVSAKARARSMRMLSFLDLIAEETLEECCRRRIGFEDVAVPVRAVRLAGQDQRFLVHAGVAQPTPRIPRLSDANVAIVIAGNEQHRRLPAGPEGLPGIRRRFVMLARKQLLQAESLAQSCTPWTSTPALNKAESRAGAIAVEQPP